ncbi:hypothetical protein Ddc_11810 [Ditylenchus destructor]|nr:hypothetical protein Ddc_11810 [Ditylenchus destructor]
MLGGTCDELNADAEQHAASAIAYTNGTMTFVPFPVHIPTPLFCGIPEALPRSRFGPSLLVRPAAFARAQSILGIMVGKVTLKLNGSSVVEDKSIMLYNSSGSNEITFNATLECNFKPWPKDYDSRRNCFFVGQGRHTLQIIGDNVKLGNKPGKSVCAPKFEDGSLLFTVEKDPEYCDADLVFYNDPPTTSATTFETRISTTEPSTDLSTTSLIIVIVCSSVGGLLLLFGLAGFIYWFFKCRRRRRVEKTAVEKDEEMVRDPLDPLKYIAKSEKDRRRRAEKEALEDLIKRLRDGKTQSWEDKVQKQESLTSQETYDKEITEAEWRWMHRRNLALEKNELYDWDKETDEHMKTLKEAGREKELREFKTYLSRPALYKRFLDEKDVALRRFNCRHNGIRQPSYAERGCQITKIEKELEAPLPFPIWLDWPEYQEDEAKKEESGK